MTYIILTNQLCLVCLLRDLLLREFLKYRTKQSRKIFSLFDLSQRCRKVYYEQWKTVLKHSNMTPVVEADLKWSHCVKSIQIRSFFWPVFSCIQTKYGHLRSIRIHYTIYDINIWICVFNSNTRKYGQEKTPYLDTFHGESFSQYKNPIVAKLH